jgi:hypothetical protein
MIFLGFYHGVHNLFSIQMHLLGRIIIGFHHSDFTIEELKHNWKLSSKFKDNRTAAYTKLIGLQLISTNNTIGLDLYWLGLYLTIAWSLKPVKHWIGFRFTWDKVDRMKPENKDLKK